MPTLLEFDLTKEEWREYEWNSTTEPYRIENPVKLFIRPLGSTHRVLDAEGIVHCIPSVGVQGCVLRWQSKDPNNPVNF